MNVSPLIERDEDGTVAVRMTEARVSACPFGAVHPNRQDSVFIVASIDGASLHWLATPDEARALGMAIIDVAERVRSQEVA